MISPMNALDHPWFVIRTEVRRESEVEGAVVQAGLEAYLPMEVRWGALTKYRRKPRKVATPLFARFVFARGASSLEMVDFARRIRQAEGLLCCRAVPLRVRPADIERLQAKEKAGLFDKTIDEIGRGPNGLVLLSKVEIIDGPLTYYGGIVRALDGKRGRATVEVSAHGGARAVEVPVDLLRLLD
jgi:transcription antitermination factor NusG